MSENTKKNADKNKKEKPPRGFYAEDTSKYIDQNPNFYFGNAMKFYWPVFKYSVLVLIYYLNYTHYGSHLFAVLELLFIGGTY